MTDGGIGARATGLCGVWKVPGCPSDGSHCSGFHHIFTALKDADCKLIRLDLTGCCLGPDDFNCLGEALRSAPSVKGLRFVGLER